MLEPLTPMKTHRGLTMLEIAIALAVMAVLATLALPSLGARLDRGRLQGAAEMLAADLSEARFEAAKRGGPLFVETADAADGAAWCWAVATQAGCGCGQPQSCQLRTVRSTDHPGVKLASGLQARLDATGLGRSTQAATLESARGDRLRVELSATGRPRICAEKGSWPRLPSC